jgi:hypothetical protein
VRPRSGTRPINTRPTGRLTPFSLLTCADALRTDCLAPSLARFLGTGAEGMGPESLISDFSRFRFLLGAIDGEGVFTPDEQ